MQTDPTDPLRSFVALGQKEAWIDPYTIDRTEPGESPGITVYKANSAFTPEPPENTK